MRLPTQGFLYLHTITAKVSHTLPLRSSEHQRFRPKPKHGQLWFDSPSNSAPSISKLLPESEFQTAASL